MYSSTNSIDPADENDKMCEIKNLDLEIAIKIAAYANMTIRDANGNVNSAVWSISSEKANVGRLIGADDLRKLLLGQIEKQLLAQGDLLLETEHHDIAMNWILDYVSAWERRYRIQEAQSFEISERILAAMHEVYFEIEPLLADTNISPTALKNAVQDAVDISAETNQSFLRGEDAVVRFLFRNEISRPVMCRMAGKLLQKKAVCNKSGNYSSKIQRNDVTQEKDEAFASFFNTIYSQSTFVEDIQALMQPEFMKPLLLDHRHVQISQCNGDLERGLYDLKSLLNSK